jgi:cytochrome c oxidase cbb3-type subunit 2
VQKARTVAIIAGFGFITLALFIQGFLPALIPQTQQKAVTRVVRTEVGDLKWIRYDTSDYTELERLGRQVYIREGCWYCHSQYVRSVTGETRRWGPVSQAGEYAFDLPHLFSTRRIGPDLTRVGMKYADGWHYAHHWDPQMVVPDTIMPKFRWLFHVVEAKVVRGADGKPAFEDSPALQAIFKPNGERTVAVVPNLEGLGFAEDTEAKPVLYPSRAQGEFKRETATIVAPTREMKGLVAYVQKLGMSRGAWRDVFEPQVVTTDIMRIPSTEEWVARGKEVYAQRCIGCHGVKGDGEGPAATFFDHRPRNFITGTFKFRTTPTGSLPTDGDLFRTVTRGIRGTAMPSWHELPINDRLAAIAYIKTFSPYFAEEKPDPVLIKDPPASSPALVARGKEIFQQAKCWECHGNTGKGDGPSAPGLKDDWGFPIRPADLTRGQFKAGPGVEDIFRTMSLGLSGTPMPSFAQAFSEEDRWALSYFVLSLSAFTDPLTGQPLTLSAEAKAALNSPALKADSSRLAFDPESLRVGVALRDAGTLRRQREKMGIE